MMFNDKQAEDLLACIDRDVARCNRWLTMRHASASERVECRRLLEQYADLRKILRGIRSEVRR